MCVIKTKDRWMRYALAVASKFFRRAEIIGVPLDDVRSEALLAFSEAKNRWEQQYGTEEDGFKGYLGATVEGHIRGLLGRELPVSLGSHKGKKGQLWKIMRDAGKDMYSLTKTDLTWAAGLLGISLDSAAALWRLSIATTESFDDTVDGTDDGRKLAEVIAFSEEETDGRPWRLNPEQILLLREERRTPEVPDMPLEDQQKFLYSWMEFLPETHKQVLMHRYIRPTEKKDGSRKPAPYETFCFAKYGGNRKDRSGGLALSPATAREIDLEAIEMLREFARGKFSRADFTRCVERVPELLVRMFMEEQTDGCTRAAVEYRLLKKYSLTQKGPNGKEYTCETRGSLKTVARVWRKRLSGELGRGLTKEEAEMEVERRYKAACKALAKKAGIAPTYKPVRS